AEGEGVEQDYAEAVRWYQKAANRGDAWGLGQCALGNCYENGYGVEKNVKEAAHWYRKAAEQGNVEAREALRELGVK
ncbi:MAG: sel1 repeat family protein, partial [Akkermansiaceae bacterium]|nr:sel1 repeat family protein [Akkermansiaceae bacterium]